MTNRAYKWLAILLALSLLVGCGDAGNYVKDNYSLIDVQGQGKSSAKVYLVEGKDVPTVAKELAGKEKPSEVSKESSDKMFLVYDNKIVHVQKDPGNEANTLVELDSIQYAKENYGSSFLQGYLTASILQSLFGGGWFNSQRGGSDYRGYTSSKRYDDYGKHQTAPYTGSNNASKVPGQTQQPATSDRKGSFTTTPSKSGTTVAPSSSSSVRRNDGSKPTYKAPASSSKPGTSSRSGSFKRK